MSGPMDWEKAAKADRVRARGGEPAGRQVVRRPKCDHRWSAWGKTGLLTSQWRRDCTRCGRIQVRDRPPSGTVTKPRPPKRREPVARTKGDLVVRTADGEEKRMSGRDATKAARESMPKRRSR